jgi:hypothetical protein
VGEPSHDDGGSESTWVSMLDPAANARALGEIQTRGLRAAGELVDRLIGAVDGERRQRPTASAGSATDSSGTSAPANADDARDGSNGSAGRRGPPPGAGSPPADLVHAWMDVFQRGLQVMTAMTRPERASARGESIATADVGRGTVTGAVHVAVGADGPGDVPAGSERPPGRTGSAEVWLHNGTAEPRTGLRLHCGDLRAHDGSTLPASALRFDPPSLDELSARSSRGVVVVADVADEVPGGEYRGVLLVAGAPDVWLPIVVTVAGGG